MQASGRCPVAYAWPQATNARGLGANNVNGVGSRFRQVFPDGNLEVGLGIFSALALVRSEVEVEGESIGGGAAVLRVGKRKRPVGTCLVRGSGGVRQDKQAQQGGGGDFSERPWHGFCPRIPSLALSRRKRQKSFLPRRAQRTAAQNAGKAKKKRNLLPCPRHFFASSAVQAVEAGSATPYREIPRPAWPGSSPPTCRPSIQREGRGHRRTRQPGRNCRGSRP